MNIRIENEGTAQEVRTYNDSYVYGRAVRVSGRGFHCTIKPQFGTERDIGFSSHPDNRMTFYRNVLVSEAKALTAA